jgi:hypothetical protein
VAGFISSPRALASGAAAALVLLVIGAPEWLPHHPTDGDQDGQASGMQAAGMLRRAA